MYKSFSQMYAEAFAHVPDELTKSGFVKGTPAWTEAYLALVNKVDIAAIRRAYDKQKFRLSPEESACVFVSVLTRYLGMAKAKALNLELLANIGVGCNAVFEKSEALLDVLTFDGGRACLVEEGNELLVPLLSVREA